LIPRSHPKMARVPAPLVFQAAACVADNLPQGILNSFVGETPIVTDDCRDLIESLTKYNGREWEGLYDALESGYIPKIEYFRRKLGLPSPGILAYYLARGNTPIIEAWMTQNGISMTIERFSHWMPWTTESRTGQWLFQKLNESIEKERLAATDSIAFQIRMTQIYRIQDQVIRKCFNQWWKCGRTKQLRGYRYMSGYMLDFIIGLDIKSVIQNNDIQTFNRFLDSLSNVWDSSEYLNDVIKYGSQSMIDWFISRTNVFLRANDIFEEAIREHHYAVVVMAWNNGARSTDYEPIESLLQHHFSKKHRKRCHRWVDDPSYYTKNYQKRLDLEKCPDKILSFLKEHRQELIITGFGDADDEDDAVDQNDEQWVWFNEGI
jgi:hypothetical protein